MNYGSFVVVGQIRARINGLEQVGDPLLASLRPFGVMLTNDVRTDAKDIGAILLSSTTG
jgi:hypothetical protein